MAVFPLCGVRVLHFHDLWCLSSLTSILESATHLFLKVVS